MSFSIGNKALRDALRAKVDARATPKEENHILLQNAIANNPLGTLSTTDSNLASDAKINNNSDGRDAGVLVLDGSNTGLSTPAFDDELTTVSGLTTTNGTFEIIEFSPVPKYEALIGEKKLLSNKSEVVTLGNIRTKLADFETNPEKYVLANNLLSSDVIEGKRVVGAELSSMGKNVFFVPEMAYGTNYENYKKEVLTTGKIVEIADAMRYRLGKYWALSSDGTEVSYVVSGKSDLHAPMSIMYHDRYNVPNKSDFGRVKQWFTLSANEKNLVNNKGSYDRSLWDKFVIGSQQLDLSFDFDPTIRPATLYSDHVFKMSTPFTENEQKGLTYPKGTLFTHINAEYNFFLGPYERKIQENKVEEILLPNMYVFLSELETENPNPIFSDFISLNGNIKTEPGLLSNVKKETFDIKKHPIGEYYKLYSSGYDKAAKDTDIERLRRPMKNILVSERDTDLIKQFNEKREMFPLYIDIQFHTDTSTTLAQTLKEVGQSDSFMLRMMKKINSREDKMIDVREVKEDSSLTRKLVRSWELGAILQDMKDGFFAQRPEKRGGWAIRQRRRQSAFDHTNIARTGNTGQRRTLSNQLSTIQGTLNTSQVSQTTVQGTLQSTPSTLNTTDGEFVVRNQSTPLPVSGDNLITTVGTFNINQPGTLNTSQVSQTTVQGTLQSTPSTLNTTDGEFVVRNQSTPLSVSGDNLITTVGTFNINQPGVAPNGTVDDYLFLGDYKDRRRIEGAQEYNFSRQLSFIILSGKLQNLIKNNHRTFKEIINGKKCYSETVMYRIAKYEGDASGEPIQNFYIPNTNDIDVARYIDTQVKYDKDYSYVVYAYQLVLGDEYWYDRAKMQGYDRTAICAVTQQPQPLIVEVPYKKFKAKIVDRPPMAPEIVFIPYKGVANKVAISMNNSIGRRKLPTHKIKESDNTLIDKIRQNQNLTIDEQIEYAADDPPAYFEVYRMEDRPSKYEDFENSLHFIASTEDKAKKDSYYSATVFEDTIEPNKKYYYTFRTFDVHDAFSNPTAVYEFEMVDEHGTIFPIIKTVDFPGKPKDKSKSTKGAIHIKPILMQEVINESQITGDQRETARNIKNKVSMGAMEESVWGKRFKMRLTSKSTGKKIDVNFKFTHNPKKE